MKLHIITVGAPKLSYAKLGWQEYWSRLQHYHQIRVTHIADKYNDINHFLAAAKGSYVVALTIDGPQQTSQKLAAFLDAKAHHGREVSFLIGGPEGLPSKVISQADQELGLSQLTFPHDLAMLVLLEALYRASTINANIPYHK